MCQAMFKALVTMELGGRRTCLFWEDIWIKINGVGMTTPFLLDFVYPKK
jgi:hypothetical protein